MSRPCKWMSMILSNVLSVTCSFILRSYQLKMLAGVGEGGGGGGWRQGVLCYTHMFCSLFHTQEPFRRSLGIILCCCILFYFHAPIIWLTWYSASLCNDQWFIRRVGSASGVWKTFCVNKQTKKQSQKQNGSIFDTRKHAHRSLRTIICYIFFFVFMLTSLDSRDKMWVYVMISVWPASQFSDWFVENLPLRYSRTP